MITWVTLALVWSAFSSVMYVADDWDYEDLLKCMIGGVVTVIFTVPAIYAVGWLFLPQVLGR